LIALPITAKVVCGGARLEQLFTFPLVDVC
jgi:hypothetical protein